MCHSQVGLLPHWHILFLNPTRTPSVIWIVIVDPDKFAWQWDSLESITLLSINHLKMVSEYVVIHFNCIHVWEHHFNFTWKLEKNNSLMMHWLVKMTVKTVDMLVTFITVKDLQMALLLFCSFSFSFILILSTRGQKCLKWCWEITTSPQFPSFSNFTW